MIFSKTGLASTADPQALTMGEKLSNTHSGAGDEWYGGPHESANQAGALSEPHNHCSGGVALQQ